MRRFKVNCIQISGKGQLLFNHGDECTDEQLDNTEWLLKDGAISVIEEEEKPEPKQAKKPAKAKEEGDTLELDK